MLKKLVAGSVGLLILVPVVSSAYVDCRDTINGCTVSQLMEISNQTHLTVQDRVSALQQAITKLTQLLAQLSPNGNVNVSSPTCLDLNNALIIGSTDAATNGEVSKLQRFLGAYRLSVMDPNGDSAIPTEELQPVTGYYGAKTATNVMQWQKAHGMDFVTTKSGVGPMTREKMRCQKQGTTIVKWDIGSKADDIFNNAKVTLSLPDGSVKTADVQVRNDCKELNQQNMNDEWMKKVNAGAVLDKQSNLIKPGLACVSWDAFAWYGVFIENGKYYVKQFADDASGLGRSTWTTIKEI